MVRRPPPCVVTAAPKAAVATTATRAIIRMGEGVFPLVFRNGWLCAGGDDDSSCLLMEVNARNYVTAKWEVR